MGCDVHMYVEYVYKTDVQRYKKELKEKKENIRKPYTNSFGGKINPGRNYCMFGCLAEGVRIDIEGALALKGLPPEDEMGYMSRIDNIVYISTDGKGDGECTLEEAQRWESYGRKITYRDGRAIFVEHPDWHSHTWLTLKEYENALRLYKENSEFGNKIPLEYQVIFDIMKSIKRNGAIPRLVMWFDN